MSAKLAVCCGAPIHLSGGDMLSPSHEYLTGMLPPSTNAVLVTANPGLPVGAGDGGGAVAEAASIACFDTCVGVEAGDAGRASACPEAAAVAGDVCAAWPGVDIAGSAVGATSTPVGVKVAAGLHAMSISATVHASKTIAYFMSSLTTGLSPQVLYSYGTREAEFMFARVWFMSCTHEPTP